MKESEEEDASESDDDEDAHLPQTTRRSGMNQGLTSLCIGSKFLAACFATPLAEHSKIFSFYSALQIGPRYDRGGEDQKFEASVVWPKR